jgi:hypothetical protein
MYNALPLILPECVAAGSRRETSTHLHVFGDSVGQDGIHGKVRDT